ncbi:MAG: hypothetical protein HY825_16755 [Acidobacteria bacterium]|nr:hypothetical protein [Acidobacteriota bacterium]
MPAGTYARGRAAPPALLCLAALAAAAPVALGETLASRTLIEPSMGILVPVADWQEGSPADVPYADPVISLATIQSEAFVGGVRFGYLFGVGDGSPCCLLGPEVGFSWVVWDPDDPAVADPYPYSYDDLMGLRVHLVAAVRVMGLWDWGWVLGRLGLGPDAVTAEWHSFDDFDGDVGVLFLAGTGVGFAVSESVGFTLLIDATVPYHEQADDERDSEFYWGFGAFELDFQLGLTILL